MVHTSSLQQLSIHYFPCYRLGCFCLSNMKAAAIILPRAGELNAKEKVSKVSKNAAERKERKCVMGRVCVVKRVGMTGALMTWALMTSSCHHPYHSY